MLPLLHIAQHPGAFSKFVLIKKLLRYYHTLRHLKAQQLWYQLRYRFVRGPKHRALIAPPSSTSKKRLVFANPIPAHRTYIGQQHFNFLNVQHTFAPGIDWNYHEHGKLWTYNLCYFDFLLQPDMSRETGLELMLDFAAHYPKIEDGLEPYPTSLRIMNWIKFVSVHNLNEAHLEHVIHTDLLNLEQRIERHLLGNHLLENSFALLFGAVHFSSPHLLAKAEKILLAELKEQLLPDGAHFELSPMYHQILLARVLESINLLRSNTQLPTDALLKALESASQVMLGWLSVMAFRNSNVPQVNDSTTGIAPETGAINALAQQLQLKPANIELGASGYRKITTDIFELLLDVGNIGPNYIPGHAHSDTLNFVLHHNQQPIIVDTGISTYEKNAQRTAERSTAAHNTVMVNAAEQSDVWGGFRVGRRATARVVETSESSITASHDGYERVEITHQRTWSWTANSITISDQLSKPGRAQAFLHFHPDVQISLHNNTIEGNFGRIIIDGASHIQTQPYKYADGFNKMRLASVVTMDFTNLLSASIHLA